MREKPDPLYIPEMPVKSPCSFMTAWSFVSMPGMA
jgi:hypothetical protein